MNIEKKCGCPQNIPTDFWDAEKGEVQIDGLAQAYQSLLEKTALPNSPTEYQVNCRSDLMRQDEEVDNRLFEAGFSNQQVQLVYDLAHEVLEPVIGEMISLLHQQNEIERLVDRFGGEERWQETSRQIRAWGQHKLPKNAFDAMACNYDGVLALYNMMGAGEPGLGGSDLVQGVHNEADVRKLMRDPRYWRDQDPAMVAQVRDGFRRLYPK